MYHVTLFGAVVLAQSFPVTSSVSKKPTRSLPCCMVASWPVLSPGEVADHSGWHLAGADKLCASPGVTHVGGDLVPPLYGAFSAWGKWGRGRGLASCVHLLQTREGERCRVGEGPQSTGASSGGGTGGVPVSREPLTTLHIFRTCRAIEKLSDHQFENYSFKISYIPDEEVSSPPPPQRSHRGGHSSRERGSSPGGSSQPKQLDFPLRMLVPTQFVGAIIGKEGLTIKNLTKQTQSK